jgi:hypothetical protein
MTHGAVISTSTVKVFSSDLASCVKLKDQDTEHEKKKMQYLFRFLLLFPILHIYGINFVDPALRGKGVSTILPARQPPLQPIAQIDANPS